MSPLGEHLMVIHLGDGAGFITEVVGGDIALRGGADQWLGDGVLEVNRQGFILGGLAYLDDLLTAGGYFFDNVECSHIKSPLFMMWGGNPPPVA